ncbi:MAG: pyridoxal-phosphate dependent enzyme [Gemmatimonadetes bacterium]|nr:pyridoxal-phosphate dependent enzyme [Gemmatimonadota bacterium]
MTENIAIPPPSVERSRDARTRLGGWVERTPIRRWVPEVEELTSPDDAELFLKLELFQRTGSFKVRGAMTNALAAEPDAVKRGLTAVSAGNHAIAVAYAARAMGTSARVVMLASANPARIDRCRAYGADIEFASDGASGFARVREIEKEDGRLFIHPFEGEHTILGTSTVGLELGEQLPLLEAVVVPTGGGGLLAGIAALIKQLQPECAMYGVEPAGADSMRRSLHAGEPIAIESVETIADSLGAPHAAPYGFSLVDEFVDDVVLVEDDEIRTAMRALFTDAKLVVEPASAAPLAAICGPLRETVAGKRTALVVSGSNIDLPTFEACLSGADPAAAERDPRGAE